MEDTGNDGSYLGMLFTVGGRRNWNKHLEANPNDSW